MIGRYLVFRLLGAGGTGATYEAFDEQGSPVALKVAWPYLGDNPRAIERFRFEARAGRLTRSAHVPQILESGETERGLPFIAMQLVDGVPLSDILWHGPLGIAASMDIGRQLLVAIEDVHSTGIVHCDIKPANILLERDPLFGAFVRLVDFGLARPAAWRHPERDLLSGTPAYMSPEQILGGVLDEATDLYAVAVVLYFAVTGHKPFAGHDLRSVLDAILEDDVPPPSMLRPTCPHQLDAIILRGLARRPAQRHPAARAMRTALEAAAHELGLPTGPDAWDCANGRGPLALATLAT